MTSFSSDIAFTDTVKSLQQRKGSRATYARMEAAGSWSTSISAALRTVIATQRSVFLTTTNAQGQPYIQHRGGPAGFLHVLDEHTIAFADFVGNRQYITQGNLLDNPKAMLFLMDYAEQSRIKIWGEAEVIEDDPQLLQRLMPPGYRARGEQVIRFTVKAWDANCPQHIPQRFEAADVEAALRQREQRIAELERQLSTLQAARL